MTRQTAKIRASIAPKLAKALASSLATPPFGVDTPLASLKAITRPDPEHEGGLEFRITLSRVLINPKITGIKFGSI
jgi:hypothetical protein